MDSSPYPISLSRLSWAIVGYELVQTDPSLALRVKRLLMESNDQRPTLDLPSRDMVATVTEAFGSWDARMRRVAASRA